MRTRGERILVIFFVVSVAFYLLTMRHTEDLPMAFGEDSHDVPEDTSTAAPLPITVEANHQIMSLENYNLTVESAVRWKLPNQLREISGLAMTPDDRLLAHDDENGLIFEIDYHNGAIVKSFALTDLSKPVADDFEGIAAVDGLIYLVTSSGRLYECREGADGETVLFNVYTTGVGREYEIEGLAYEPSRRALLLMSKEARRETQEELLTIYHWSIDTKQLVDGAHLVIPLVEFTRHIKGKKFHPSGIERHPTSGNYFVVAAREEAIAEITPAGRVIGAMKFPGDRHRQAEGVTFASDNTLIVSDEGAGKRARLTLYPIVGEREWRGTQNGAGDGN